MNHNDALQMNTSEQSLLLKVLFRLMCVQVTVNGCCNFIAQCILVRINLSSSVFIHLNLQRSTVVGSSGVKISVSLSFLDNLIHKLVNLSESSFDKPISTYFI